MEMAALMSWEQPTLVQKLVGVLGHARGFVPHRVFDNVRHDTNLTLECLASTIRLLDFLPRVLYLQADGASDNCSQVAIAFMVFLVAKGIVEEVSAEPRKLASTPLDQSLSSDAPSLFCSSGFCATTDLLHSAARRPHA